MLQRQLNYRRSSRATSVLVSYGLGFVLFCIPALPGALAQSTGESTTTTTMTASTTAEAAEVAASLPIVEPHRFIDITDAIGLGPGVIGTSIARGTFADLNNDGYADIIVNREHVFVNLPAGPSSESPIGRQFFAVRKAGLPSRQRGGATVFADLDNDGNLDAIITQSIDGNNPRWEDHGKRTAWRRGNGDGTFEEIDRPIYAAPNATTASIAVADVNHDGKLDFFLGNWYLSYGETLEAYSNDLLIQSASSPRFPDATADNPQSGQPFLTWWRSPLPSDSEPFTAEYDLGGRPTYGTMIANLDQSGRPELMELNYGRRWNRVWQWQEPNIDNPTQNPWHDRAPQLHLDGDEIRHGAYPAWLKERAKTDPRFDRPDEAPFRANGNTFDCTITDFDNDGDFDIFIATIAHGWAGESSDRSRLMLNQLAETGSFDFKFATNFNTDRIPANVNNWNQGDLFGQFADLDQDGRVDLLLSSGDYPDNQRLRFYRQTPEHTFVDATAEVGLDHDGSQQISLADINGDGALDILVGQTFNRYSAELKEGREPRLRVFLNQPPTGNRALILRLAGDPELGTNTAGLGTIATVKVGDTTMTRQLIGIGGHAGKQLDFILHFGIGTHDTIDELTINWPNAERTTQRFENVAAGSYTLKQGDNLRPGLPPDK